MHMHFGEISWATEIIPTRTIECIPSCLILIIWTFRLDTVYISVQERGSSRRIVAESKGFIFMLKSEICGSQGNLESHTDILEHILIGNLSLTELLMLLFHTMQEPAPTELQTSKNTRIYLGS